MKDRSLQDPPDPFAEALLRSAEHDGPTPRDRARVAASLGLAGATTVTASAAKASSTAPAAAKASLLGGMVKWWLGGLGVAFLVGTFAGAPDRHAAAPAPSSSVDIPVAISAVPAAKPAPAMSSPVVDLAPAPVRPTRPAPASTPAPIPSHAAPSHSAPEAPTAAPSSGPSLADELAALDAARRAIEAGDADAAEQALSRYRTTMGEGRLASEAELLAIESAAARAEHAQTIALGAAFLARHPSSPHRARVTTLITRARKEAP